MFALGLQSLNVSCARRVRRARIETLHQRLERGAGLGCARRVRRARIETSSRTQAWSRRHVAPAACGGRGLKQVRSVPADDLTVLRPPRAAGED